MFAYILRRLLLIIPTLLGVMLLNYTIIQAAPGGPVEKMLAQLQGFESGTTSRLGGSQQGETGPVRTQNTLSQNTLYRGAQGIDPELIQRIEKLYGFDKPTHERFLLMLQSYARFDFGDSFFRDQKVITLIMEKLPVSISLGLWSTLIIYLVSIPLGIRKAVAHGSSFDVWTSYLITLAYAVPGFLFALILVVFFCGGSYLNWFPLRGLTSANFEELSLSGKIFDYLWHLVLPVTTLSIGGFATLTMLTKNSFLDEINKHYVITARAKGLGEQRILYGHVFRNAMLLVVSGIPAALVGILFTGALLIEVIFSLDGLGLLSFESALNRDYPVIFGTLYIFTLIGLLVKLAGDLSYMLIDPRIDFSSREN